MRPPAIAVAAALGLVPGGARSAASDTRSWVEARSANFVVVSDAGAKQARRIATRFEQIREVFHGLWPRARLGTGEPSLIVAVRDEKALKQLLPDYWEKKGGVRPAGVFFPGSQRSYVALRADLGDVRQGMSPYLVLYHEYIHVLLDLNFTSMPVWLGEGLADFFGNTLVEDDALTEGKPIVWHVALLRQRGCMPLKALLKVDHQSPEYREEDRASVFYAQSWALVHYLLTDEQGTGAARINLFLALLGQGVPEDDALVRAFGDLARLEKDLDDYVRQYAFRYATKKGDYAPREDTVAVRELSAGESLGMRGVFMAERGRPREAADLLEQARGLDASLAVVHEGLGLLAWREDRPAEARSAFARAIELGSTSAQVHYLYGTLLLQDAAAPGAVQAAAAAFQGAVDLNHDSAPAYSMLAQCLARGGEPPERTLPLARRAVSLEPGDAGYRLAVARILLEAGRLEEAQQEIGRALGLARDERERGDARELLEHLRARAAPVPSPGPAVVVPPEAETAAEVLERQCGQADVSACASLGWLYHDGAGVTRDAARAAALFAKACAGGHADACLLEADARAEGRGVERDAERAGQLFQKACELGKPAGCTGVGVLELRRGTAANLGRAAGLFRRACDDGDGAGCANLAALQEAGFGVPRDGAAARASYAKACAQGYEAACARSGSR